MNAEKIVGCLSGGMLGDAYASRAERGGVGAGAYEPDWRFTDDTQLTLATCEAVCEAGRVDPERIAGAMARWFLRGDVTGVGAVTLGALRALACGGHWALCGLGGERAAGGGAAMRIAPCVMVLDPSDLFERMTLRDVARITHKNEEAWAGALGHALALRFVMANPTSSFAEVAEAVCGELFDSRTRDNLRVLVEHRVGRYEDVVELVGASGFAASCVPVGIWAGSRACEVGVTQSFEQIVAGGGDTDTISALAGQVFGAAKGVGALPAGWIDEVVGGGEASATFARLARAVCES